MLTLDFSLNVCSFPEVSEQLLFLAVPVVQPLQALQLAAATCLAADTDVEEASPQPDEESAEDQPEVRSRVVPNTKRLELFTPEKQE